MRTLCISLLLVAAQAASNTSSPLPQFDVASVKPNQQLGQPSNNWQQAPSRTDYHNSQIAQLIKAAWGDFSLPIEGGPRWIVTDRYDVVVSFPVDTPAATRTLMLRALLMDRFKLAAHLETREVPIYNLVMARYDRRIGPKLGAGVAECAPTGRANPPPTCGRGVSAGRGFIDFGSYDMAMVARILSGTPAVGRRVVDKTGLTGSYRIDLEFAPAQAAAPGADAAPPATDAPSIFTALQEQLGLKLEDAKGQGQFLVVDHIEPPTPD